MSCLHKPVREGLDTAESETKRDYHREKFSSLTRLYPGSEKEADWNRLSSAIRAW